MILAGMLNNMGTEQGSDHDGIEVRVSEKADRETREKAWMVAELFKGPLFAKMVRDAVEEMILEGKLAYDLENDVFDVPEDIVKRWAASMENRVWSKERSKR